MHPPTRMQILIVDPAGLIYLLTSPWVWYSSDLSIPANESMKGF